MPRYPGSIAKFKMLQHELVDQNPELTEVNEMSKRRKLTLNCPVQSFS